MDWVYSRSFVAASDLFELGVSSFIVQTLNTVRSKVLLEIHTPLVIT